MEAKKSQNRNPIKQFFITFAQSRSVTKEEMLAHVKRFNPDYYKIVKESHQDGNPHIHALFRCIKPYSQQFVLKYFKKEYPNDWKRIKIEAARSIKNSRIYFSKEDPDALESGDFYEHRQSREAKVKSIRNSFLRTTGVDLYDGRTYEQFVLYAAEERKKREAREGEKKEEEMTIFYDLSSATFPEPIDDILHIHERKG